MFGFYVLRRHEDGKYVARPGTEHSYTRNLADAQRFKSADAANRNKCGNESAEFIGTED